MKCVAGHGVNGNCLKDKEKCAGSIMLQKKEEVRLYK